MSVKPVNNPTGFVPSAMFPAYGGYGYWNPYGYGYPVAPAVTSTSVVPQVPAVPYYGAPLMQPSYYPFPAVDTSFSALPYVVPTADGKSTTTVQVPTQLSSTVMAPINYAPTVQAFIEQVPLDASYAPVVAGPIVPRTTEKFTAAEAAYNSWFGLNVPYMPEIQPIVVPYYNFYGGYPTAAPVVSSATVQAPVAIEAPAVTSTVQMPMTVQMPLNMTVQYPLLQPAYNYVAAAKPADKATVV